MFKPFMMAGAMVLLAGCAVGPEYQPPTTPEPASFHAKHESGDFTQAEHKFWEGFGDPLLARLIAQTLAANQDLKGELARYDRAAALLYGARQDQWPSLTVDGEASRQHLSAIERAPPGSGPDLVDRYRTGIAAAWEPDLFGRLRRATESRSAEVAAVGADVGALKVAMAGQLASSYFELRGLQLQYRVAKRNVALQQDSLDIVTARVNSGRGTEFDQVRARAQLQRTRAELPTLQADIHAAMHRIAVLTGQPPEALVDELAPPVGLPPELPVVPVDSPGDVLRRRPDIAAAERRLAAATARVGVATADLFPHFTLGALVGWVAADSGDLLTGEAESRRVVLGIDWSFLDHDRVEARIAAADADSRIALAKYQQSVLVALEETETRLVRYHRYKERARELQQAADDAEHGARLARTRYQQGYISYFEELAAEQELTTTEDSAVRSRTAATLAMVDLYRALAGAPPSD